VWLVQGAYPRLSAAAAMHLSAFDDSSDFVTSRLCKFAPGAKASSRRSADSVQTPLPAHQVAINTRHWTLHHRRIFWTHAVIYSALDARTMSGAVTDRNPGLEYLSPVAVAVAAGCGFAARPQRNCLQLHGTHHHQHRLHSSGKLAAISSLA